MFAHWTETSKALLRGEVPPVFRVRKRKLDDITEVRFVLQSISLKLCLYLLSH